MKNNVKKLIVSLIAIVMFAYVGVTVFAKQAPVDAVTVTFTATDVNDNYDINEKATFPLTVDVEYKGSTKTAEDGVLVFPSGKVIKVTESAIGFTEQGEYSLRYFFMDGNVKVTAEKTFKVSDSLYYLTNSSGSITPVTAEMNLASDFRSLEDNTMGTEKEGIILRLSEGCEFRYNKPVDLSKSDELGLAHVITIDPRVYETSVSEDGKTMVKGNSIVSFTRIRLTDCYDPTTYVEILLCTGDGTLYLRAGTNLQQDGGLLVPNGANAAANAKEYYLDGVRGLCRLGHGGQWDHGYSPTKLNTNTNHIDGLRFDYDLEKSRLYCTGSSGRKNQIINDFESESIYGDNLFPGFTTGEVFVSIFCDTYNLPMQARIDVLSIGEDQGDYLLKGYNLDESNPNYDRYQDTVKPMIKVDADTENKIYCAVGDTFKIPTAKAYDVNLASPAETKVYRNYGSEEKINVRISNGEFKLDAADTYYIEYSAVDKFGNRGVEVLKVYGVLNASGKSLGIETDKLNTLNAGENTKLPAFVVSTVNDPASVSLEIIAKSDKETIKVASLKGLDIINELGASGIKFMPKYAGEYTITFNLKDNVYDTSSAPFEYKVTCVPSNYVSFLEAPFLERYLIKNAVYGLREFNAYEFTKGEPNAKKVDAFVSFDGGEFTKIQDTNKVLIEGDKTVQIKYAVDETNYVLSDIVKIADVNFDADNPYDIIMNKYFQYEEDAFTVDTEDEDGWELTDIVYMSNKTSGTNKLSFVNSLFYNKFVFEYKIDTDYADYTSFDIILTDVKDPTFKNVITVGKNGAVTYLSVNGGTQYSCNRTFGADAFNTISYDNATKRLLLGDVNLVVDFECPSKRYYLDVQFNGIYGNAGMLIRTINNQKLLGDAHFDSNVPEINITRTVGNFAVGEVLTIHAPDYADILSPIDLTSVKYIVKFGETVIKSVDGVLLDGTNNAFKDVQVKLDTLGEYSVQYMATDISGQQVSGKYFFSATDGVAPVISLADFAEGATYQVKLGQKLTIEYEASDNLTATEDLYAAVLCYNLTSYETSLFDRTEMEEFQIGTTTFFIVEEGLHRINVYCRDAAGNATTVTFYVMVVA